MVARKKKKTAKKAQKKAPLKKSKPAPKKKAAAKKKKAAPKKRAAPKKKAAAPKKKAAAPKKSAVVLKALPFLWKYETGKQAVGLCVDQLVWAANDNGEIFALTRDGDLDRSYKLPGPVHCLVADEAWKYAGCNDGNVYDLTGRRPQPMYEVDGKAGIDWLEIHRGTLCVSDHDGGLTVMDVQGNVRWQKRDPKMGEGWMVRADDSGVFHGGSDGVRAYDWNGKQRWAARKVLDVRFGWAEADEVMVTGGYLKTAATTLHVVAKKTGKVRVSVKLAGGSGWQPNGAESCSAGHDESGALRLFASNGAWLFCYDGHGNAQWSAPTKCGSACTMQLVDDRLYMVTNTGTIACVDVSAAAIDGAVKGKAGAGKVTKAAKVAAASRDVEEVDDAGSGVVVEVVKEGGKLRVKVVSDGYNADWFCQFPRDLREEGARYVVDEVREATQGGFYRVLGDIKRLKP